MILNDMLMNIEKHEIHNDMLMNMKKHELMIAIFNCKTCVKKLMRLKMNKGSCIRSKELIFQIVSLSLLVEHVYYHTGFIPGKIK